MSRQEDIDYLQKTIDLLRMNNILRVPEWVEHTDRLQRIHDDYQFLAAGISPATNLSPLAELLVSRLVHGEIMFGHNYTPDNLMTQLCKGYGGLPPQLFDIKLGFPVGALDTMLRHIRLELATRDIGYTFMPEGPLEENTTIRFYHAADGDITMAPTSTLTRAVFTYFVTHPKVKSFNGMPRELWILLDREGFCSLPGYTEIIAQLDKDKQLLLTAGIRYTTIPCSKGQTESEDFLISLVKNEFKFG